MKKKIISAMLVAVWALFSVMPVFADEVPEANPSVPPEIENVGAATVYNIENDTYIYKHNADKVIYPASTAKLMTAIVAIEALGDQLWREVMVSSKALEGVRGNNIALKRGEVLTVEQLLLALICGSANDAANILAFEVAGSVEAFVDMMNAKAKEIGALNTHYTNPTGLHDPGMVTTASDTALIAAYAYKTEPITEMSSLEKFTLPKTNKAKERTVFNKNYFYSTVTEFIYLWSVPRGLNAGYTEEGGYCLATTATRDGLTYVVVTMEATRDEEYIYSYTEAAKLVKWAFDAYEYTDVLSTSEMICELPVRLSSKVDYVTLFPAEPVELYLPAGIDVDSDVELKWTLSRESFTAPVSEGEVAGEITVMYDGKELATVDLVTRNNVNRDNILYVLDLIIGVTRTRTFKTLATIAVIALAAYIAVLVYMAKQRNKYKKR